MKTSTRTEEEKRALKEQQKEERRRQNELLEKQLKADELRRELKYGALNIRRHEKSWKQMLLTVAVPTIRKELEYAWHNFERIIDAKDFIISLLLDEIRDDEELYMMNIRSHCEDINNLIRLFKEHLDELKIDYENSVQSLKAANEKEIMEDMIDHKEAEEFLNLMRFGLEMALKEQEQFIRCEYYSRIDEDIGRNTEILQKLRLRIHGKYAKLWNDTQDFLENHYRATRDRQKQYEFLNTQDEQVNALLTNQLEKITQMNSMIKKIKQKHLRLQNTQGQKVIDFQIERQFFTDSFWALKTRMEEEINTDNKNLTLLTVETNESIQYLEELRKKGEKILTLASMCRKFETQKEKVLPFPLLGKESYMSKSEAELPLLEDIMDLKVFWNRLGQVEAVRYSIYEERDFLMNEHRELRKKIHEYCACLNCSVYPPPQTRRSTKGVINNIDGNMEIKKYHRWRK